MSIGSLLFWGGDRGPAPVFIMNVLLVRPPATFHPGAIKPSISLPLGLISIAAVLEQAGIAVKVYDAQVNTINPVSPMGETILMGEIWGTVTEKIATAAANIVGVTCGFSAQVPNTLKFADLIKKTRPGTIVIVGGPAASVMPDSFLWEDSPVDVVCIGEGEYTMLELVQAVAAGQDYTRIEGTAIWNDGGVRYNSNRPRIEALDEIPFPAYHLVKMEDYFQLYEAGYADRPVTFIHGFQRAVSVVTSRGCPFNCVFCSIHLHMGKRWRGNSIHYIKEHLVLLLQKYGVRHIHFEDDNISFNQERFEGIVASLADFGVTWDTPNGVRVDTLTEQLVKKCKKSGCTYLVFGVESGDQRILDTVIDKRLDLKAVIAAASWCHNVRLDAMAFFVIGSPGETREDMLKTVSFAMKLKNEFDITPLMSIATPLPGTRLEQICLDAGCIQSKLSPEKLAIMTQGNFNMDCETFTAKDIDSIRRIFFRELHKTFIVSTISYLISNPLSIVRLIKLVLRIKNSMSIKEKILSIMHVKNATLGPRA